MICSGGKKYGKSSESGTTSFAYCSLTDARHSLATLGLGNRVRVWVWVRVRVRVWVRVQVRVRVRVRVRGSATPGPT